MSKALETEVVAPSTDVAVVEEPVNLSAFSSDVADISSEDIWLSKLRLAHGISPEVQAGEARPGQWLFDGLPPMASVLVVPVAMAKPYRRYAWPGDGTNQLVCSDHVAEPDVECPHCRTQAIPELAGKSFNATTEMYYQYIIYMPEHGMPAQLDFARSGVSTAKRMNQFIKASGWGNVAFKLSSEQVKGSKGTYNVPVATKVVVDPAALEEAQKLVPKG